MTRRVCRSLLSPYCWQAQWRQRGNDSSRGNRAPKRRTGGGFENESVLQGVRSQGVGSNNADRVVARHGLNPKRSSGGPFARKEVITGNR